MLLKKPWMMSNCNISSKGIILTKITNSIFVYRNCINEVNSIIIIVGFIVSNLKLRLIKTGRWNNVSEYKRHCTWHVCGNGTGVAAGL